MSDPQFPDPLGVRELIVPGGTSHKAGPMLEDRLKAVERGAANRSLAPESLLTTRGDVITRGASAPQRLALGTAGQHLASDGTDAVWVSAPPEVVWTRGSLISVTTTAALVMAENGVVANFNSTAGYRGVLSIQDEEYETTGTKLQMRLVASITTPNANPARALRFDIYPVTALSSGALTVGSSLVNASSSTLAANSYAYVETAWVDVPTSTDCLAPMVSWDGGTASAVGTGVYVDVRIETKRVAA